MTQKEISARFYQRRIAAGLCPKCGSEKPEGRFYCGQCREKENARHRENRAYFKSIGICPVCQKEALVGEEKQCISCRQKAYERRQVLSEEQKQRYNERFLHQQKEQYSARSEAGICTRCGKRQVEDGKKRCTICLAKDAEYHRIRKYTGIRDYRERNGLCVRCGAERDRIGKICKACAEKSRPKTTHEPVFHVWREDNNIIFGR